MQSQCTSKPHTMPSAQHNMYIPDWMEPIHVTQCPLHPDSGGVWPSPPLHSRDNHVDHRKKEGLLHQWIHRCTECFSHVMTKVFGLVTSYKGCIIRTWEKQFYEHFNSALCQYWCANQQNYTSMVPNVLWQTEWRHAGGCRCSSRLPVKYVQDHSLQTRTANVPPHGVWSDKDYS